MMLAALRKRLSGGDRRSIGNVPAVLKDVARDPRLVAGLVELLDDQNPLVRMRAADALEKASAANCSLLRPFATRLRRLAQTTEQQELRWHLAQMMPRLAITRRQRIAGIHTLLGYLEDRSSIVRACALQGLAELAAPDDELWRRVERILSKALRTGTPAMRARARHILASRLRRGS